MQRAALLYTLSIFSLTALGVYLLFNAGFALTSIAAGVALLAVAFILAKEYEWFSARFGFVLYSPGVSMNAIGAFYGKDTTTRVKVFFLLSLTIMGFPFAAYFLSIGDYLGGTITVLITMIALRKLVAKLFEVTGKLVPEDQEEEEGEEEVEEPLWEEPEQPRARAVYSEGIPYDDDVI